MVSYGSFNAFAPSNQAITALYMYQATIPCENSMDRNPNYPDKNIQIQGCGAKKYPSSSSVNLFFMEKKISLDTWFFPAQMKYTWFFPAQIKFFLQKPPDCIIRLLITCRVSPVKILLFSKPMLQYRVQLHYITINNSSLQKWQAMVNLMLSGSTNNSTNSSKITSFQLQRIEPEVASVLFHTWQEHQSSYQLP